MGNISQDIDCAPGKYLIDANVWLYIHSPITSRKNPEKTSFYASIIQKIISNSDCQMLITPLLISEYINRRMRDYYSAFRNKKDKAERERYSFKRYREDASSDYGKYIRTVLSDVKGILDNCCTVCDPADSILAQGILDRILLMNIDTNDSFFVELCKQQCAKLVTDDGDFVNCDIEVLSDNRKYN